MLLVPLAVLASLPVVPARVDDGLQPWRHVLALKIRDEGFGCGRVVDVVEHGFEHEGRVALVVCHGGFGREADGPRPYRVIFYTEGDITVRPWPRLEARGP
jgi:hypothetical protein